MWMRSAINKPMTSRETFSTAMTGLSVFGSERSATTRSPPYLPGAADVTRYSSAGTLYTTQPNARNTTTDKRRNSFTGAFAETLWASEEFIVEQLRGGRQARRQW